MANISASPINHTCIDCGRRISRDARRCKSCAARRSTLEKWSDPEWRDWRAGRKALREEKLRQERYPDGTKTCSKCGETKSLDEFAYQYRKGSLFDRRPECVKCQRLDQKRRAFLKFYGITWEDFLEMHEKCGGRCEICGVPVPIGAGPKQGPYFDHDHKTGKPRGVLCGRCNLAIGQMNDDPDRLKRAAEYLRGRT
jgi:hypothetical protein